jgi:hypothetical protein
MEICIGLSTYGIFQKMMKLATPNDFVKIGARMKEEN